MKSIKRILFLFLAVSLFAVANSQAQIVVKIHPERPRVIAVRPARPSRRHVWVAEGWTVVRGRYVYRAGYWAIPPRGRKYWVPGHWSHHGNGDVWIEGHWA